MDFACEGKGFCFARFVIKEKAEQGFDYALLPSGFIYFQRSAGAGTGAVGIGGASYVTANLTPK
jgi:hypothetical protein